MTNEKAINYINDLGMYSSCQGWDDEYKEACDVAVKALEKQKAISELQPPTDDWENYANRLYDLAYLRGYSDGLIAKEENNTDGDNKRN